MLNVHWQPYHRSGEDRDWFAELSPSFVKVVWMGTSPPYSEDVPLDAVYIYRDYAVEDTHRHLLSTDPARLGYIHAEQSKKASDYLVAKGVPRSRQLFESMNEPALWAGETPEKLAVYLVSFLTGLHSHGLHGVVGNLGVGWPDNYGPDTPPVWDWFEPVYNIMQPGDYLSVHEYWADGGVLENWGWWAGRVLKCPYNVPILITECGVDSGVKYPGTDNGWMNTYPGYNIDQAAERYTNELWEYMNLMRVDNRIQGVFPYTYDYAADGDGHSKWADMDQNIPQLKDAHRRKIAADGIPAPQDFTWGTPDPEPPPVTEYEVHGIDVSDHQGVIDWQAVKDSGLVQFAMIRASVGRDDGSVVKDGQFDRNWAGAKEVGLPRAAYHFLNPHAWKQAVFFSELMAAVEAAEMGYYLDIEHKDLTKERVTLATEAFDKLLGLLIGEYTRKSLEHLFPDDVGGRLLWAADWRDVSEPAIPKQWDTWEFWQTGVGDAGTVPGIETRIDLDVFNGTMDAFLAKYGNEPQPPLTCDAKLDYIIEMLEGLTARTPGD